MRFFAIEDGIRREATKDEVFSFFGNPAAIDFEGMMLAERMVDAIEKNPLKLNIKTIADDHLTKLLRENMYLPYDPRDHTLRWHLAKELAEFLLYNKSSGS